MSGNHSPTPWMLATNDPSLIVTAQLNAEGNCGVVADVLTGLGLAGETEFANAELIVTAVNAYASNQSEIELLRTALEFYRDGFEFHTNPRRAGLEWKPTETLLDDCGNTARLALLGGINNG